jgi:hypothetical protein
LQIIYKILKECTQGARGSKLRKCSRPQDNFFLVRRKKQIIIK